MALIQKKIKAKGTVEVRMVNPKRTGFITLRDYRDKKTGKLREFKDSNGNPRIKKYSKASNVLHLENEDDRLEYLHVKDHPLYCTGPNPILIIVDVVKDAQDRTDLREASIDAMAEARKLIGTKLRAFARVLGINTSNVLEAIIKDRLYDIAEETPMLFLKAFNDENKTEKEILFSGKQVGIFTQKNLIWKFRDTVMGGDIDAAILWLKDNQDLMPSIRKEIATL